jgi:uncharacterized protein
MDATTKPVPHPTPVSAPYWDGAASGKLMLQRCTACATVRHYPRLYCSQCYSSDVAWIEASKRGTVHSWTVTHHAFHPAFADELPYTLVTVDLEEGVRVLGRYHGTQPLKLGLPVRLRFAPDAQGTPGLVVELAT